MPPCHLRLVEVLEKFFKIHQHTFLPHPSNTTVEEYREVYDTLKLVSAHARDKGKEGLNEYVVEQLEPLGFEFIPKRSQKK